MVEISGSVKPELIKDTLVKAKALIEKPEHWTTMVMAADRRGELVATSDSRAYSFCAIGAVTRTSSLLSVREAALDALRQALPSSYSFVSKFNDSSNHSAVLGLFDRAIARVS